MKKLGLFCLVLLAAAAARADSEWTTRDKTCVVRYTLTLPAATTSTSAILIDLSDTVNFPHKDTGSIVISRIVIDIDKVAAATTTVRVGVVNFVNASTGSVTWFDVCSASLNVTNTDVHLTENLDNAYWRCLVKSSTTASGAPLDQDGVTPYILSNDKTTGSTTYQTDVLLPSPISAGAGFPGKGDIVLSIVKDATNAIVYGIEILYHSDP